MQVLTPLDDRQSCGIALVHVEGIDTGKLQSWLWSNHRIMTTPIGHPEFNGLRVTPSIYTTLDEVDRFVDKMRVAIRNGVA